MNVYLIAGHGAGDPGAVAIINGKRYREADETRIMLDEVAKRLSVDYMIDVFTYSTDRNAYADLCAGKLPPSICKNHDLMLEIHFNAYHAENADGKTKGVECYVPELETQTDVPAKICAEIAKLGFRNRGVKKKNYSVIREFKRNGTRACLLEVCFLDDPDDMAIYLRDNGAVAAAIVRGIASAMKLAKRPKTAREIVQQAAGLEDQTMQYLDRYRWHTPLYEKLAKAITKE